jgi:hypothetical protein
VLEELWKKKVLMDHGWFYVSAPFLPQDLANIGHKDPCVNKRPVFLVLEFSGPEGISSHT